MEGERGIVREIEKDSERNEGRERDSEGNREG